MLGDKGFDCGRLFREPEFAPFSEAAVAAASRGSAEPFRQALGQTPSPARVAAAAFASSFQGLAPVIATLRDVEALPEELAEFFRIEGRQSAARAERLIETCLEVTSALATGGCDVAVLKGAALLLSPLAPSGLRPMGDIDLLLLEPDRMEQASGLLRELGWKVLFDTRRHRVFAREDERVVRPGCEDPGNPIRIELHYALRLPVLGRTYDVTGELLGSAVTAGSGRQTCRVASGNGLRRHLLVHAAEDFAAAGLRGVQAADFRVLSQESGPLSIALAEGDIRAGLAPLAYAALAVERLFPGSFAPGFLASLRAGVPEALLERAGRLPVLRKTRPERGWTRTALSLVEKAAPKVRFFLRSAFPPLEEVKVNVAPEASGAALARTWLKVLGRRLISAARPPERQERDDERDARPVMLRTGEIRVYERFGPTAVNRGGILVDCEWDGGLFESGVMLGGIFRSGTFRGGVLWAGFWKGGTWEGGLWHHGFGPDGRYRPRDAPPGSPAGETPTLRAAPPTAGGGAGITVFAATAFPDLVRIWHACLLRALPPSETIIEVYDDSAAGDLDASFLPGATILRRGPDRPDFQVAYNDALARATTPFLAFVDTDIFCISRDVWRRVRAELERPEVAAVSCVSREAAESPGTFAVVMKVAAYREALGSVPGGFVPLAEREASGPPPGRWIGHDTGDLAARAVRAAGYDVILLRLEEEGEFVRFDAVTITRLIRGWAGEGSFLELAVGKPYFRRGALGNLALRALHDRVFRSGPRSSWPVGARSLWGALAPHPRTFVRAVREWNRYRAGARRIEEFLAEP